MLPIRNDGSPPRRTKLLIDIYKAFTFALHVADPVDFKEAMKSKEWEKTMDGKIESITSNNTCELCELLERKKSVALKWIYKTKFNTEG